MKTIVLAALTALPFFSQAQKASVFVPFPDNGIYLSANDFTNHIVTDGFNDTQTGYRLHDELFKPAVKIVQPTKGEIEIPDAQLWGERKKGVDFRRFNGDLYKVEHADRIYIYSKPLNLSVSGQTSNSSVTYYFSRQPNSPIHAINADNLKDIYYDQPGRATAFDELDALNDDPAHQVYQLIRLFYTNDIPAQSVYKAD